MMKRIFTLLLCLCALATVPADGQTVPVSICASNFMGTTPYLNSIVIYPKYPDAANWSFFPIKEQIQFNKATTPSLTNGFVSTSLSAGEVYQIDFNGYGTTSFFVFLPESLTNLTGTNSLSHYQTSSFYVTNGIATEISFVYPNEATTNILVSLLSPYFSGGSGSGTTYNFSPNFTVTGGTNVDIGPTVLTNGSPLNASAITTGTVRTSAITSGIAGNYGGVGLASGTVTDGTGDTMGSGGLADAFGDFMFNGGITALGAGFTGSVANTTNRAGVSMNQVVPTNTILGMAAANLPAGVVTNIPESVYIEAFGGKGDEQKTFYAVVNSSSTLLVVTNPTFTAADAGKAYQLFQDVTNITAIPGTISSFNNSTSVVLSTASSKTGTFTFKWGTDNTAALGLAVTNLYNLGGGELHFRAKSYAFAGPMINNGINSDQFMVWLPSHPQRQSATNLVTSIAFIGTGEPMRSISTISNTPAMTGTILDVFTEPTNTPVNWATCNAFIYQNGTTDFTAEQYSFSKITFRERVNPHVAQLWFSIGGCLKVSECAFDVEYPLGYALFPPYAPYYTAAYNPPTIAADPSVAKAIVTPSTSNNSQDILNTIFVYGYGGGIILQEHAKAYNLEIQRCGTCLSVYGSGTFTGPQVYGAHLLNSSTPIYMLPNGTPGVQFPILFSGIEFENNGYQIGNSIVAPSNNPSGYLCHNNGAYVGTNFPQLEMLDLTTGAHFIPVTVTPLLASDAGSAPINTGLVLDIPFSHDGGSSSTWNYYDRSPNKQLGQVAAASIIPADSPDGAGLTYLSSPPLQYPTNAIAGFVVSNLTVDLLVKQPTAGITYSLAQYSGNSPAMFYIGNSWQCGWRTTTANGPVTVTTPPTFEGGTGLTDGKWHDLCGTYNGTNMVFFIDGVNVGNAAQTGPITNATSTLLVGAGNGDSIAHVRVWNRVLSTNEINFLASSRGLALTNQFQNIVSGTFTGRTITATNGFILPQLASIPTNSMPVNSASVTNWTSLNLNGTVYYVATNFNSGGWLYSKQTGTVTTSP
jgi:hypothetical protein